MSIFVQYGQIGTPIIYKKLPDPSQELEGIIIKVDNNYYICNNSTWYLLSKQSLSDIKYIYYGASKEENINESIISTFQNREYNQPSIKNLNITTTLNDYVYFIIPEENIKISSDGYEVPINKLSNSIQIGKMNYYIYRTDKLITGINNFNVSVE